MKITVIRHGETEGNIARIVQSRTGGVLTQNGIRQAEEAANILKKDVFDAIYSSDLERCIQTTKIVSKFHPNTHVSYQKQLRERHLGDYEAGSWDDVPWLDHEGDNLHVKMPNGESWEDVYNRVGMFLSWLYQKDPSSSVLLVSHGGTMKAMRAHIENITLRDAVDTTVHHNAQILRWQLESPLVFEPH